MKKFSLKQMGILWVSFLALIQTGCANAKKYEKIGRAAAAGIFETYMAENKAKIMLEGCETLNDNYDKIVDDVKKKIVE